MSYRLEPVLESGPRAPLGAIAPAEDRAMREAIRLARRGIGTTHPNPRVGAVVLRGDAVVGTGYHARAGDAHAEARALDRALDKAAGATLVVTLEPCAHSGQQPPCADWRTGFVLGKQVHATLIQSVPLQFQRDLLLAHEHGLANSPDLLAVAIPVGAAHAESQGHRADYDEPH